MARRKIFAGTTSLKVPIFVNDSSSSTGAGLAIVFNTAGLVAEYRRDGDSAWTAITLVAGTLGTFLSGSIIADGALTGAYELSVPNAVIAAGVTWAEVRLRGATNMLPVLLEFELDQVNYQSNTAFVASVPAVVGAVGSVTAGVTVSTNNDKTGYALTVTPPTASAIAAVILANPSHLLATDGSGNVSIAQAFPPNFATLAITVPGAVAVGTVADKTGYSLAAAGLDQIPIETGVNIRQAMSPILSASAGMLTGAGTGTVTIKAGGNGNQATTRITATTDASFNRTSVTLALPT